MVEVSLEATDRCELLMAELDVILACDHDARAFVPHLPHDFRQARD